MIDVVANGMLCLYECDRVT